MPEWLTPLLDVLPASHRAMVIWVLVGAVIVAPVLLKFLREITGLSESRTQRIDKKVEELIAHLNDEIVRLNLERQQWNDERRRLIDQLQIMQTTINSLEEHQQLLKAFIKQQHVGD